jgi:hypothetical protein
MKTMITKGEVKEQREQMCALQKCKIVGSESRSLQYLRIAYEALCET